MVHTLGIPPRESIPPWYTPGYTSVVTPGYTSVVTPGYVPPVYTCHTWVCTTRVHLSHLGYTSGLGERDTEARSIPPSLGETWVMSAFYTSVFGRIVGYEARAILRLWENGHPDAQSGARFPVCYAAFMPVSVINVVNSRSFNA